MPGIDCLNNLVTAGPPCLSQGKWNSRKAPVGSSLLTTVPTALDYIRQRLALAKTIMWTSPDTTPILQETPSQQQWEHMHAFHLSTLLWLSEEWKSQTQMEGDSPLIWTMLHPPSAEVRLQTYAWTGHLKNYMPGALIKQT